MTRIFLEPTQTLRTLLQQHHSEIDNSANHYLPFLNLQRGKVAFCLSDGCTGGTTLQTADLGTIL